MLIDRSSTAGGVDPRAWALRALFCGVAAALAAPVAAASPGAATAPEARRSAPPSSRELSAEINETVRRAVEHAHEAAAAAIAEVPRALAQIDFDDLIADTTALAFIGNDLGGARDIVKNAPYSAEAITESVQLLPDGNRIVRKSTTFLARDRFGRTRQERRGERGTTVYISDPIEGTSYALNSDRKTAVRIPRTPAPPVPAMPAVPPMPPMPASPPAPPTPPVPPPDAQATKPAPLAAARRGEVIDAGPGRVFVRKEDGAEIDVRPGRVVVRKDPGRTGEGDDVRVEVVHMGGDGTSTGTPALRVPGMPTTPRGKGETKDLGTRDFDGVKAEGRQTTHTIPAGAIGNEKPIVVASERWFSPELHIVVSARTTDPRAGETHYRLVNVKRGDPPAELFRLPDDYRVRGERGK